MADLEFRDLAEGSRQNYRDNLRLHVLPAFEHYTLAEITTGRVEWFLKAERQLSVSRAKQSRTLLNLMFSFTLRHDAITRSPVQGTSPLPRQKGTPQALTLEQIAAIRQAAATWRSDPKARGPKNDGQVRDIIEVLLGTAMRTGEVLALRPCAITDGVTGMVAMSTAPSCSARALARCDRTDRRRTHRSATSPYRHSPRRCCGDGSPRWVETQTERSSPPDRWPAQPLQRAAHLPRLSQDRWARAVWHQTTVVPTDRSDGHRMRHGQRCGSDLPRPFIDREQHRAWRRWRDIESLPVFRPSNRTQRTTIHPQREHLRPHCPSDGEDLAIAADRALPPPG
jgi:integrase